MPVRSLVGRLTEVHPEPKTPDEPYVVPVNPLPVPPTWPGEKSFFERWQASITIGLIGSGILVGSLLGSNRPLTPVTPNNPVVVPTPVIPNTSSDLAKALPNDQSRLHMGAFFRDCSYFITRQQNLKTVADVKASLDAGLAMLQASDQQTGWNLAAPVLSQRFTAAVGDDDVNLDDPLPSGKTARQTLAEVCQSIYGDLVTVVPK